MSDAQNLPLTSPSWRGALLQHAATVLLEGRDADGFAYVKPNATGIVDSVQECTHADELPENAVVITMLCGVIERRIDAIQWPEVDRDTGEILGAPVIGDTELHTELLRHADRLWRAWRDVQIRRQVNGDF